MTDSADLLKKTPKNKIKSAVSPFTLGKCNQLKTVQITGNMTCRKSLALVNVCAVSDQSVWLKLPLSTERMTVNSSTTNEI